MRLVLSWLREFVDVKATAEDVAKEMLLLCLPECSETGRLYSFRETKFIDFHAPA